MTTQHPERDIGKNMSLKQKCQRERDGEISCGKKIYGAQQTLS